jgi:hypothetical protein
MMDQVRDSHKEHIWLIALYELEEKAEELLDRLSALGIDTSEATTLRVEIDQQQRAARFVPVTNARAIAPTMRSAITGALTGAAVAMLIGMTFYSIGMLNLSFVAGMFNHVMASVAVGALVGAAAGAAFGSVKQRKIARDPISRMQQLKSDGYLVAVKMAPRLAEQAEEIARGLGAKEILL